MDEAALADFVDLKVVAWEPTRQRIAYFSHTRSAAYELVSFLQIEPPIPVWGLPLGPEKLASATLAAHGQRMTHALAGYVRVEGAAFDGTSATLPDGDTRATVLGDVLTVRAAGRTFTTRVHIAGYTGKPVVAAALPGTSSVVVIMRYEDHMDVLDQTIPYILDTSTGTWK